MESIDLGIKDLESIDLNLNTTNTDDDSKDLPGI